MAELINNNNNLIDNLKDLASCNLSLEVYEKLLTIPPHVLGMIQIAELQVELMSVGFKPEIQSAEYNIIKFDWFVYEQSNESKYPYVEIRFTWDYVWVSQLSRRFFYNSPTFKKDVLTTVKELINA